MRSASVLLALVATAVATAHGPQAAQQAPAALGPHANETSAEKDARMKWWREARFGMFVHWGLYAEPAGTWNGHAYPGLGEWLMHDAKIPVDAYAALALKFNPVRFDADRWVAVAKAAGMRYVVVTAKHHEGFAMFRSSDAFNVWDATPFKRDPVAELAAACRKAGLKFGVYYSQAQDWSHPGGGAYGGNWDPKQSGDLHAYVRNVAAPQLRELMRYKPAVLWWDTPVEMSQEDVERLTAPLPRSIIMNNRLGNGVPGDTETPEQTIPSTGFPGRDWETCMTINDTWGFKKNDTNFKPTAVLLRNLIDIASKGGNYLLNVGPDAQGVSPEPEIARLLEVGAWLQKNGRSVYATTASPYRRLPFNGRATVKGDSLFLNVFEWPAGGLTLPGLTTRVKEVREVATGARLGFTQAPNGAVTIQGGARDPISTALELKLVGRPVVVLPEAVLSLGNAGRDLPADEAEVTGGLQIEHEPANVGYWTNLGGDVSWKVEAKAAFRGKVALEYACADGADGSEIALQIDGQDTSIRWTVAATGGWDAYRTVDLPGELTIPAGKHVLKIVAKSMPHGAVMNLRRLRLAP